MDGCAGIARKYGLLRRCAHGVGLVALVFSLTVATVLTLSWRQARSVSSARSKSLALVLAQSRATPGQAELVQTARELDRLVRHAYFSEAAFRRQGVWLLLVGLLTAGAAFHVAWRIALRIADPRAAGAVADVAGVDRRARWAVLVCGGLFIGAGVLFDPRRAPDIPASGQTQLAPAGGEGTDIAVASPVLVDVAWGSWRGADGIGLAGADVTPPLRWDVPAGVNVRWKTLLGRAGASSPVVAGERVFLVDADEKERRVRAFALADGRELWSAVVPDAAPAGMPLPVVTPDTGFAASSPACDGQRVYVVFATGDLAAFTHDGRKVWQIFLGRPQNSYGHASSLLVRDGRVVVQWCQAEGGRMLAVRAEDGVIVWEKPLDDAGPSWASPIVVSGREAGRFVAVMHGHGRTIGFDLADGAERWRVDGVTGEVAPSPAWDGRYLVLANAYSRLVVFDLSGADGPRQVWENSEGAWPDVSSPVAVDGLVYVAPDSGDLACYDLATGQEVWKQTYDDGFYSSPVVAAGRVYVTDRTGVVRVVRAGRTFELLAANPLGESADATPAFCGGRVIVRGRTHLFCLAEP